MLHFIHTVYVLSFSSSVFVLFFCFLFCCISFTLCITFKCLLLHVYALSCNGILDFLCSRCCATLRLETYIVQLGVRTFYKLLAFCPGLLHRISFCVLYFCMDDAWCNKVTYYLLLLLDASFTQVNDPLTGQLYFPSPIYLVGSAKMLAAAYRQKCTLLSRARHFN